jgi:acyl carrier protein
MAITEIPVTSLDASPTSAGFKGVTVSDCDKLKQQIAAFFVEHLNVDVPSAQTDLIDTGILDSLKFVDLLLHVEQKFGAKVDMGDLDLDNFRSIEKIADFVARRRG